MELVGAFEKQIRKFIRLSPNSMFNVHNPHGIKLLTRLQVDLSHLLVNTNVYTIFKTPWIQRKTLFNKISNIKRSLLNQKNSIIVKTFLFGLNGLNGRECIDNRVNNQILYNRGKVHSFIVMNPFKQFTTSPEISN